MVDQFDDILPTAFFSESGAEGELDPCLVIDADRDFYAWLISNLSASCLKKFEMIISGLHVVIEKSGQLRTHINDGVYVIEIPYTQVQEIVHVIQPHSEDQWQQNNLGKARKVHVFLDVSEGFEVIFRKTISARK